MDAASTWDVVILGAGIAGLSTAHTLSKKEPGLRILVLERRQRLGGRVHSVALGGCVVDVGASWIHGIKRNPVARWCKDHGIETIATDWDCEDYRWWNDGSPLDAGDAELVSDMWDFVEGSYEEVQEQLPRTAPVATLMHTIAQRACDSERRRCRERQGKGRHCGSATCAHRMAVASAAALYWQSVNFCCNYACDVDAMSGPRFDDGEDDERGSHNWLPQGYGQVVDTLCPRKCVVSVAQDGVAFAPRQGCVRIVLGACVERVQYVGATARLGDAAGVVHCRGTGGGGEASPHGVRALAQVSFWGRRIVCTLPLGVLQAGAIHWQPRLPRNKRNAIRGLGLAHLNKVVLVFERAFWPDVQSLCFIVPPPSPPSSPKTHQHNGSPGSLPRHADVFRAHAAELTSHFYFNLHPGTGVPTLVAFLPWAMSRQLPHVTDEQVVRAQLQRLSTAYSDRSNALDATDTGTGTDGTIDASQYGLPPLLAFHVTRWSDDPASLASYSFVPVGGSKHTREALAQPVSNVLFWAGEATCTRSPSTVTGAMRSGKKAARQVLRSLT